MNIPLDTKDFVTKSYESHSKNIATADIEKYLTYPQETDGLDYQLLTASLAHLHPFLAKKSRWLTIADFRGFEAHYLKKKHQEVMASDLIDNILKVAKDRGFIDDCTAVNVEQIPFKDNTYDYVFCREALHHFPKAFWGLYEMIRVAKKAAIICEPQDILGKAPWLMLLKNILDIFNVKWINKIWKNRFSFETVGNYVFKISERDIEKIAMGLGLPCIAFKGYNLFPWTKHPHKEMLKIKCYNILTALHLLPYRFLSCVIFKEMPTPIEISEMQKSDFKIIYLPKNPYL
ncbi:MAG: class I SAM-dependent methyltransferase [Bacteroidales bacterium]